MKKMFLFVLVALLPLIMFAVSMPTIYHPFNGKVSYTNDRSYRISQMIEYGMEGSTWVPQLKYVYYYQSAHPTQIDSVVVMAYDPDFQEYTTAQSYHYTYNAAGRVTNVSGLVTFPGFGTIELFRLNCTYDGQNRINHYYMYLINSANLTLVPAGRIHFIYSSNRLSQMLSWDNLDDKLVEYSIATFTADTQGRAVLQVEQTSSDSTSWVNSTKDEIMYHPHDNSNASTMVEFMSAMLPSAMVTSSFMFPGMPQQETESAWSGTAWVLSERNTYTWNAANDQLQEQLWENWSGTAWTPSERDTYTHDANGNVTVLIEQTWAGRTWTDVMKMEYSWQGTTANEDPETPIVNSLQLAAYPMPFSGVITLLPKSDQPGTIKLGIYNLKGQLVTNISTLPGQEVQWDGKNASGLRCANGVYFVRMEQNNKVKSTKIIKIK